MPSNGATGIPVVVPASTTQLDRLRNRLRNAIKDTAYRLPVLQLSIVDEASSAAVTSLYESGEPAVKKFKVTVTGGTAPSIDWFLTNSLYSTLGELARALSVLTNYQIIINEDIDEAMLSTELRLELETSCLLTEVQFNTRAFSDIELDDIITDSMYEHNPNFTMENIPTTEEPIILILAQIKCFYVLAGDSAKFYAITGQDSSIDPSIRTSRYLDVIRQLEARYTALVQRLGLKPIDDEGSGSVTVGQIMVQRKRDRSFKGDSYVPELAAPVIAVQSVTSSGCEIYWPRFKTNRLRKYEIYYSTNSSVTPDTGTILKTGYNADECFYTVTDLNPETVYYFRMVVYDTNWESVANSRRYSLSNEIFATTLAEA